MQKVVTDRLCLALMHSTSTIMPYSRFAHVTPSIPSFR